MAKFPGLADRVWYAWLCLPDRFDSDGREKSWRTLESESGLSHGVIGKTVKGDKRHHEYETLKRIARALRTTADWLADEEGEAPVPPPGVIVTPRPGMPWRRHGDVEGWDASVKILLAEAAEGKGKVPPEAFLAAADMAVYRPVDRIDPDIALGAAMYCWATRSKAEQIHYSHAYHRPPRAAALKKRTK